MWRELLGNYQDTFSISIASEHNVWQKTTILTGIVLKILQVTQNIMLRFMREPII